MRRNHLQGHWTPVEWQLYEAAKKNMSPSQRSIFALIIAVYVILFLLGATVVFAIDAVLGMIMMIAATVLGLPFFMPRYSLVHRARERQCCFGCGYSLIGVSRDVMGDGI